MAKNKLDVEIMVDVTEGNELQASGKVKGLAFLGRMTKEALTLISKEVGKAVVEAMDKTKEEETTETTTVETTVEETLV